MARRGPVGEGGGFAAATSARDAAPLRGQEARRWPALRWRRLRPGAGPTGSGGRGRRRRSWPSRGAPPTPPPPAGGAARPPAARGARAGPTPGPGRPGSRRRGGPPARRRRHRPARPGCRPGRLSPALEAGAAPDAEARAWGDCDAPGRGRPAETAHDGVDGVLGHAAVGGELAPGHRDHARGRDPHGVAARQVGGAVAHVVDLAPGRAAGAVRPRHR